MFCCCAVRGWGRYDPSIAAKSGAGSAAARGSPGVEGKRARRQEPEGTSLPTPMVEKEDRGTLKSAALMGAPREMAWARGAASRNNFTSSSLTDQLLKDWHPLWINLATVSPVEQESSAKSTPPTRITYTTMGGGSILLMRHFFLKEGAKSNCQKWGELSVVEDTHPCVWAERVLLDLRESFYLLFDERGPKARQQSC